MRTSYYIQAGLAEPALLRVRERFLQCATKIMIDGVVVVGTLLVFTQRADVILARKLLRHFSDSIGHWLAIRRLTHAVIIAYSTA